MDQRQTQIREGAGLEEARINTEFIDFLRKWSTPVLLVIVLIAGAYVLNQRMAESRAAYVDEAFSALGGATSPASLIDVADTYGDVGSIAQVARIRAADRYMEAVVSGVKPGAVLTPEGVPENEDDVMTPQDREDFLGRAQAQYDLAWEASSSDPDRVFLAAGAAFGLAAIAETRGNADEARRWYAEVKRISEASGDGSLAEIADGRLETLDEALVAPELLSRADLPAPPTGNLLNPNAFEMPITPPSAPVGVEIGPDGGIVPMGPVPVSPAPEGAGEMDPADAPEAGSGEPADGGNETPPQR